MMYGYYGHGYGFGWGGSLLGLGLMVVFWVFFALLIVAVVRGIAWRGHHHFHHGGAMEILKARYAKGEIKKEEFEAMKKDLAD